MRVHAVLGVTGAGKTSLATAAAHALGVPVVVADRIQCFRDIPVVSSRPSPDHRRVYLDDRTIPEGDLTAHQAYSRLRRILGGLADRHRTVILEGGSVSLLTMLFRDLPRLGFELHADVLPARADSGDHARRRILHALDRGLLAEFQRAWAHAGQRDFVRSIAGFDVLAEWCERQGSGPDELARVTGAALAGIVDELVERSLSYTDRQAGAFRAAGVRPLGQGRDRCCRMVNTIRARSEGTSGEPGRNTYSRHGGVSYEIPHEVPHETPHEVRS
ncbi:isopentenyl transferase family protein [Actinomadura scrupuli]|uniref:isopentenyl transferase family protein n=1 Tax=Actinomadura scrupuli TaxID=559629 RepID=UPI003D964699